jgi:hypothetical protein
MKLVTKLVLILCIYGTFYSHSTLAQRADGTMSKKTVNLKCHVEFFGGENTILYYNRLSIDKKEFFAERLPLKYSQGKNNKQSIYKVNECVEKENKFKDKIANTLEEKLNEDM